MSYKGPADSYDPLDEYPGLKRHLSYDKMMIDGAKLINSKSEAKRIRGRRLYMRGYLNLCELHGWQPIADPQDLLRGWEPPVVG